MYDTIITEHENAGVINDDYREAVMLDKLKRYAELKVKQDQIEAELKDLKAEVSSYVFEQDGEQLETQWGKFEIRQGRKTWKYSEELILQELQAKEAIKHKKKQEELSGKAVLEKAPSNLVFTAVKDK